MTINLIDLATYFVIYSLLGWILESTYCSFLEKRLVNRGFLHGPFCPIYGTGALIMYIFLQDFKGSPVLIFCFGFVVLSIWEYIVGVLLEKTLNTKYWDYSDNKYNLQGRVCLLNSVFWGVLSVIFINFIHPVLTNFISKFDQSVILHLDIVIITVLVIDGLVSLLQVIKIRDKLNKLEEINRTIKEKLMEIRKMRDENDKTTKESIKNMIRELKVKQMKLKRNMYKNILRLKKAFPSIDSDIVSKILNYKLDLKRKEKITKN